MLSNLIASVLLYPEGVMYSFMVGCSPLKTRYILMLLKPIIIPKNITVEIRPQVDPTFSCPSKLNSDTIHGSFFGCCKLGFERVSSIG